MTTTVQEVRAAVEKAEAMEARELLREGRDPVFVQLKGERMLVLDCDGFEMLELPAWLAGLHVFGRQADVDRLILSLADQVERIGKRCVDIGRRAKARELRDALEAVGIEP